MTKRFSAEDAAKEAAGQVRRHTKQPKKPPRCNCHNHLGGRKQMFKTKDGALRAIIRNHMRHGNTYTAYRCPTSEYWHVTSADQKRFEKGK